MRLFTTLISGVAAITAAWGLQAISAEMPAAAAGQSPEQSRTMADRNAGTPQTPSRKVMTRSADNPGGSIYGIFSSGLGDDGYRGLYGAVDLKTGDVETIYTGTSYIGGEYYYLQDAAVRDGVLYIPEFDEDMITLEVSIRWKAFDTETGKRLDDIKFEMADLAFCYALTYDSDQDLFYGLAVDMATFGYGQLVEIDPATWQTRHIGNVGGTSGNFMASLAYNPADKSLYGLKDNGVMYSIDPQNATCYEVKVFEDYEEHVVPTEFTARAMVYSPTDHCFVTTFPNNELQVMQLAYINTQDGSFDVYDGEMLPQGYYVAGIVCTDEYAPDNAPGAPELTALHFEGPSLDGTFSYTAPTQTFDGRPLISDIGMTATIDGMVAWSDEVAPGTNATVSLTVEEGEHVFELYSSRPTGETGPKAARKFYAGHDVPQPPYDLTLEGSMLYWKKPTGSVHGGFIDMTYMTYDVYLNGNKVNAEPLDTQYYILDVTGEMKRTDIEVTATANGKTSIRSQALSDVLGDPLQLPATFEPTPEESRLFRTINANNDVNKFEYCIKGGNSYFAVGSEQYYQSPDDWFILPALYIPTADSRYKLSFEYSNYYGNALHKDDLEIFIGTSPTIGSMTTLLYSHTALQTPADIAVDVDFGVPQAGPWYIAFHSKTSGANGYRGAKFRNISVSLDEASSAFAPGEAADLAIEPAPLGELKATARFTAPTLAVNGTELDATETIDYVLAVGTATAEASAMPGEAVEITVDVTDNGMNNFFLTPSTASQGKGVAQLAKAYIGIDVPLPPSNVRTVTASDNLSYTLSWDAPDTGINGGYVDPAGLKYMICVYSPTGYTPIATTDRPSYTYTPSETGQAVYTVAPVAVNQYGQSAAGQYAHDCLGAPYELPMSERFGTSVFDYTPWTHNTDPEFSDCPWSSISSASDLRIGNPVFTQGGLMCMNLGNGEGRGELISPKSTTLKYDDVLVRTRFWNYEHAASLELYGRTCDNPEYVLLGSTSPQGTAQQWVDWDVELPAEFTDKGWVQFRLRALLPGFDDAYCLLDGFGVLINAENDFRTVSVAGPDNATVGEDAAFNVVIMNSGLEIGTTNLTVELMGDGTSLASQSIAVGRTDAGRTYDRQFTFPMLVEYLAYDRLEVRATVSSPLDEIEHNNSRSASFRIKDNILPTVTDLTGRFTDSLDGVELTWSRPDSQYGGTEDFELMPSFTLAGKLGRWTNIDRDGGVPFSINGLRWDNDNQPCGWVVFDTEKMGTAEDPRLCAPSGKQFVLARALQYNEGDEPQQSSDWLISPEIVGGTDVTFMFGTLDSTYPETIGIWYSTTDDNIESFVFQQPFTKSGSASWEEVSFTLPEEARYFAFEYRGWGTFGAMIDDVVMTPVELSQWDIDSYRVYRTRVDNDETSVVAERVEGTVYLDTDVNPRPDYVYHVTTMVADAGGTLHEGPRSNAAKVQGTSVEEVTSALRIAGGKGHVYIIGAETGEAALYTADGVILAVAEVTDGKATIAAEPGIYIVKVGNTVAKVMVK